MAINLAQLSNTSAAAVSLSNLVLVTPQQTIGLQPQNAPSYQRNTAKPPPAILFTYNGEEATELRSDITDHFIEDNTAIQDQVALRPETYTVHGFIGELNDVAPAALQPLKTIAEKLTAIGAYTPQLSTTATLVYANAFQAYQIGANLLNTAISTWSTINGGGDFSGGQGVINGGGLEAGDTKTQTRQQIFFQQFYGYWRNRTLFTVQTPWAVFQDMAIERLRAIQSEDTRMISDFEITFKLMRFASTQIVTNGQLDSSNFQGRGQSSAASEVDLGTSSLSPATETFPFSAVA